MPGLNSRTFMAQWQALYARTNPGHLENAWTVGGVRWTRERQSHSGPHYSVQLEIHHLEWREGGRPKWQFMMVQEHWWGSTHDKSIRDTYWCKHLSGRTEQITAWMKNQEREHALSLTSLARL
jgi:hypothetical protein